MIPANQRGHALPISTMLTPFWLLLPAGSRLNTSPSAVFTVPCGQEFNPSTKTLACNILVGCESATTLAHPKNRCRALANVWRAAGSRDVQHATMPRGGMVGHSRRALGANTAPFQPHQARHATGATPRHPNGPGARFSRTRHTQRKKLDFRHGGRRGGACGARTVRGYRLPGARRRLHVPSLSGHGARAR